MSYRKFTFEQIAATFTYEPDTGELFRRLREGANRIKLPDPLNGL
jgi:hypothetical protein